MATQAPIALRIRTEHIPCGGLYDRREGHKFDNLTEANDTLADIAFANAPAVLIERDPAGAFDGALHVVIDGGEITERYYLEAIEYEADGTDW